MLTIKKFEQPLITIIFRNINTMTLYDLEFFKDNIKELIQTYIDEEGFRLRVTDRLIDKVNKKIQLKIKELTPVCSNG